MQKANSQPSADYSLFNRGLLTRLSRVLLSLRDTLAFQNPVPYLPPCSNARDGFTAERSPAMRQCSQDGPTRQTWVFPVPSCCPYAQHPPQAPLPQVNFMPGLFLPSGVSQLMETGLDEGSLCTSARTQHPLPLMPRDGETKMKPSALQGLGLPEGLWLFSKRKYKTIIVSGTRMGQLRNDRTCPS